MNAPYREPADRRHRQVKKLPHKCTDPFRLVGAPFRPLLVKSRPHS